MPIRADILLVEKGLFASRARAQSEIVAGRVYANGRLFGKPSQKLSEDTILSLSKDVRQWVSRSAEKLDHALDYFNIGLEDLIVLDIGASTGGFTQVALQRGASKVMAVDVGHDQLHASLRELQDIVVLENTNAKNLSREIVRYPINAVVCDVSFIGLRKVLPAAMEIAEPGAILVALIKPQFEVGPELVGRGGIVRDTAVHENCCKEIHNWIDSLPDWHVHGLTQSPILGKNGNKEFLIAAKKSKKG